MSKEDSGPAFPIFGFVGSLPDRTEEALHSGGMTLRQYAAIKLRVPESGTDWLDEMIRKSMLDEFAAKSIPLLQWYDDTELTEKECYLIAAAMLKEREK